MEYLFLIFARNSYVVLCTCCFLCAKEHLMQQINVVLRVFLNFLLVKSCLSVSI